MTKDEVLSKLQELGTEKLRAYNIKNGSGENTFGVKMGDIRALAKAIKSDPDLAKELWATRNLEARLLATLIEKPKTLSPETIEQMVKDATYSWLADWVATNITKQSPHKEELRKKWMESDEPTLARAAWSLTTERVCKSPEGLDIPYLLNRIDKELPTAHPLAQWTMNFCLGEIGINFEEHRERAVAIGEKHGLYSDYPVSKGCITPYVPTWVAEMVKRKA
jgi:3-methyladenine DNA glycosylase AlkD